MATTSGINASGISVGTDGKIKVSGLNSSIDWQGLVDTTIKAKRLPAVRLEKSIETNTSQIAAYGELKSKTTSLTSALDALRGNPGFGANNVFKTKAATGTTAATAGAPAGHVASGVDSLLVASVGNNAVDGNYKIVVQQTAAAQQIRSDSQTSKTTALGLSGTFTVNGKAITLKATDTLLDVRATLNASGAGVTSTVVSASDSSHYLVATANKTGTDNALVFGGDTSLTDALGLTASGSVKTELQAARNAIVDVNGITGIERQSNEISDLVEGVTLSLQKAEANTEISLTIATDLSAVKTSINDFVTAYNELKTFISDQKTASDRNGDGTVDTDEFGALYGQSVLRQIENSMSTLVSADVSSNTDGYKSLSQLGISIDQSYNLKIDSSVLDSRLLTDVDSVRKLFGLDVSSSSGQVLLVGRGTDTASGTYYLNVAGTDASGNVTSANISAASGTGAGGAANGSVSVSGNILTAGNNSGANGLRLLFNGGNNAAGQDNIQITVSRGLADQFFGFFDDMTKASIGGLDTQITNLQTQNQTYLDRVDVIDNRLDITRTTLVNKYVRMETALAQLENLKKTIQSYTDASNGS